MSILQPLVDRGVPQAAVPYFTAGPNGQPLDLMQRPDDPNVQRWLADAVRLLEQAGRGGNVDALMHLSAAHAFAEVLPADRVRSLAYGRAAFELMRRQGPKPPDPVAVRFSDEGMERLTPAQRQAVDAMVADLLSACCTRP